MKMMVDEAVGGFELWGKPRVGEPSGIGVIFWDSSSEVE